MIRATPLAALALMLPLWPAQAADAAFKCPATPTPVVMLDHGSRYVAEDASRSDFDEAANSDVTAQLKPIDDFITDLAQTANRALAQDSDQQAAADCVLASLAIWARADALSQLDSDNAHLSMPARLAGLAMAYAQAQPMLPPSDDRQMVEDWMAARAKATMAYFDTDAPPKASRNNLRAWAGLAVAQVGLIRADTGLIDWADASARLVVCQAAPDGSLPLEMARKELALHYQLHALTALVITAALLDGQGQSLFDVCDGALHRAVGFAVKAFDTPDTVARLAGKAQSYSTGKDKLQGFELAWATAYLARFPDPGLTALVKPFLPLANSKIGGKQALLWPRP
jgi:poly(beta-D-mannuronate) lyase